MSDKHHQTQFSPTTEQFAVKPFLKIGEVAKLIGVKPHVLRYWESEFPTLKPKKNPSGQRIYAKEDIEAIVEIKNLLYNERYTISGAKRMLARQRAGKSQECSQRHEHLLTRELGNLKGHIRELLALLEETSI